VGEEEPRERRWGRCLKKGGLKREGLFRKGGSGGFSLTRKAGTQTRGSLRGLEGRKKGERLQLVREKFQVWGKRSEDIWTLETGEVGGSLTKFVRDYGTRDCSQETTSL